MLYSANVYTAILLKIRRVTINNDTIQYFRILLPYSVHRNIKTRYCYKKKSHIAPVLQDIIASQCITEWKPIGIHMVDTWAVVKPLAALTNHGVRSD